ncbi:hypothetical protein H0266_14180 [Halobacillus locisalis]|uniref:DUF4367 domain-containing protein n=1 Tax=Halobacillus locisalis TaxID=220753 RepID=A0A838CVU7_9BACI|nr:hypothetical protein [Halobacillus locisalis]MBA2176041.1 hypothetical protein [Halobacillus locisalis]
MKKILTISFALGVSMLLGLTWVSADSNNSAEKTKDESEQIRDEQDSLIPGLEEAQSKVPYSVRLPNLNTIPEDIRGDIRSSVNEVDIQNYKGETTETVNTVSYSFGTTVKSVGISQAEATVKPPFLDKLEQIEVEGTTVYVDAFGDNFKMFFWKDDMYYLVSGEAVTQSQLKDVIKSILTDG